MGGHHHLGDLRTVPVRSRPALVGAPVLAALERLGWLDEVGVVEVDDELSDTAATQAAYRVPAGALGNCVVVAGRREGDERIAACVVAATTRADVNGAVRRRLDVRKASFLPMERAVEATGMAHGAITPIGLPAAWPVLVDRRVVEAPAVLLGAGVRPAKLVLPGALLAGLPGAEVVDSLGVPIPA